MQPVSNGKVHRRPIFKGSADWVGQSGGPEPAPQARDLHGLRVLVVEDDEINQVVARHILEKLGLSVTVAGSGLEAVALAAEQSFDAVFMDIGLPGIDGYEAAARIRAHRRAGGRLPIIAMTGSTQRDPERMRRAGLNDFLVKPIDLDQLRAVLDQWLRPDAPGLAEPAQEPLTPAQPVNLAQPTGRLDSGAALERLAGNRALYLRLLKLVRVKHGGDAALIRAALLAGDVPLAHLLAHTLKGVAGTIGAAWLQDAAQVMELASARHAPNIDPLLVDGLETALAAALRAVDLELAEMEPPA